MKLSDIQKRLAAPFPAHAVQWKPGVISKDRSRALMLAHIDARSVQDRLDAICPDAWAFDVEVIPGTRLPAVKGTLTVLGVTRSDIGEAQDGELGTLKAAASDALKRCAVHFGIGRYLYDLPKTWVDWNDAKREPVSRPTLPEWARPDHERTPGGAHLVQAMDQLRIEAGQCDDVDAQREVYKHLKAALSSLHPPRQDSRSREDETEGDPANTPVPVARASNAVIGGISKGTKGQIAAYLEGPRWGLDRDSRLLMTAFLAERPGRLGSSQDLTEAEGLLALGKLQRCRDPQALIAEWQRSAQGQVA